MEALSNAHCTCCHVQGVVSPIRTDTADDNNVDDFCITLKRREEINSYILAYCM